MHKSIFFALAVLLLLSSTWGQERGPLRIVDASLFPADSFINNSDRNFETAVRGRIVLENERIGRVGDIKVAVLFFDHNNVLLYREEILVETVESKASTDVGLFWANPSNVSVQRAEGVVIYQVDEQTFELPFLVKAYEGLKSPGDSYNNSGY